MPYMSRDAADKVIRRLQRDVGGREAVAPATPDALAAAGITVEYVPKTED